MRFVPDPEMWEWLMHFGGDSSDFDWDHGNRFKNLKHEVAAEDVESLFENDIVLGGLLIEPVHEERRWLILGIDQYDRKLTLIATRRGEADERLRPISCRTMRKKEKEYYAAATSKTEP